jgi:hypothetical protein
MSLSRGRSLLKQIHQRNLVDIGADGEIDIIQAGTALAEFHRLGMAAIGRSRCGCRPRPRSVRLRSLRHHARIVRPPRMQDVNARKRHL